MREEAFCRDNQINLNTNRAFGKQACPHAESIYCNGTVTRKVFTTFLIEKRHTCAGEMVL